MKLGMMGAISKVAQAARAVKNPQQAVNLALDALSKRNPSAANAIRDAIKSGKSPSEFAREQAQNGALTEKNLQDLKTYYGMAKNLGFPSIPEKDWKEIENAIKSRNVTNRFSGF